MKNFWHNAQDRIVLVLVVLMYCASILWGIIPLYERVRATHRDIEQLRITMDSASTRVARAILSEQDRVLIADAQSVGLDLPHEEDIVHVLKDLEVLADHLHVAVTFVPQEEAQASNGATQTHAEQKQQTQGENVPSQKRLRVTVTGTLANVMGYITKLHVHATIFLMESLTITPASDHDDAVEKNVVATIILRIPLAE